MQMNQRQFFTPVLAAGLLAAGAAQAQTPTTSDTMPPSGSTTTTTQMGGSSGSMAAPYMPYTTRQNSRVGVPANLPYGYPSVFQGGTPQ